MKLKKKLILIFLSTTFLTQTGLNENPELLGGRSEPEGYVPAIKKEVGEYMRREKNEQKASDKESKTSFSKNLHNAITNPTSSQQPQQNKPQQQNKKEALHRNWWISYAAPTTKEKPQTQEKQPPKKEEEKGLFGYRDKDKSWGQKGLDFIGAGGTFVHSSVGHTGNVLGQGVSLFSHGLGSLFSGIGTSIDKSPRETKETIALGLGYSLAAWAFWRLYYWGQKEKASQQPGSYRSWLTFLVPDWAMAIVGHPS